MAKTHYTPEQKAAALQRLRASMGDLPQTSRELGIPERTLRDWRHEFRAYQSVLMKPSSMYGTPIHGSPTPADGEPADPPPPNDPHPPLTADTAASEFESLRMQLMTQIMQMTANFPDSMESATSRAVAISRLLTWVFKLDEIIPAMHPVQEYVYRVEYKDPDGSLHSTPPWSRKTFDNVPTPDPDSESENSDPELSDSKLPPDHPSTPADDWFA